MCEAGGAAVDEGGQGLGPGGVVSPEGVGFVEGGQGFGGGARGGVGQGVQDVGGGVLDLGAGEGSLSVEGVQGCAGQVGFEGDGGVVVVADVEDARGGEGRVLGGEFVVEGLEGA